MNFAFVIDNRRCIGCHACSTACKAENSVPLGVHRTWVKYVEKGVFPDTRRYFQVTRCNHCANPPCVPICPTAAMYQRDDGIVEFDSRRLHRLQGVPPGLPLRRHPHRPGIRHGRQVPLLRAPHRRRPRARVRRRLSRARDPRGRPRRPGLGSRARRLDRARLGAQARAGDPAQALLHRRRRIPRSSRCSRRRPPATSGAQWPAGSAGGVSDWRGPIQIAEGRMAGALMRSAAGAERDVQRRPPRSVALAGPRLPRDQGGRRRHAPDRRGRHGPRMASGSAAVHSAPPAASLLMTLLTTALLVGDLDRPERFWKILARPQWRSWLTRGALVLIGLRRRSRRSGGSRTSPERTSSPHCSRGPRRRWRCSPRSTRRSSSRRRRGETCGRARFSPRTC